MSSRVERGPSFVSRTPEIVVPAGYLTRPAGNNGRNFDVTPDGQRFLMLKDDAEATQRPAIVIVVQHFFEELKRLAPAGR